MEKGSQSPQMAATSLGRVPSGHLTIWAITYSLGRSATRKGSLVVTNGFPTPFGINEPESSPNIIEQPSESDPEKIVPVAKSEENALPPFDGGRRAWAFLLGAATIEGLMGGFPMTFGVFQSYFQAHPPFEGNRYISVIGVLTLGVSYLGNPIVTPFTIRYQKYLRHMICIGWVICVVTLVSSSFATKLWHLILTQGFLYGAGMVMMYYPVLSMLNEWFVKRRGLAYGLMFGSAGACGLGLPFIVERMLHLYGYATTLRAFAIGIFILVGPMLPLLKPRLPPKLFSPEDAKIDTDVFSQAIFISSTFSNIFQGLGFFLPGIYLPSYAADIGLSHAQGALVLSLLNISQIAGQIGIGHLADRYDAHIPLFLSPFFTALWVFLIWGFSKSLGVLLVFSILYGVFAGGYSVLYCRFATSLTSQRATGLWLYAIFEFQRGAGNIIGGSISGLTLRGIVDPTLYGMGKYEGIILLVGVSMLVSSFGGIGWFFRGQCFKFECIFERYIWPHIQRRNTRG